jgi:hypothetical protein
VGEQEAEVGGEEAVGRRQGQAGQAVAFLAAAAPGRRLAAAVAAVLIKVGRYGGP